MGRNQGSEGTVRLHQLLAVEKDVSSKAKSDITLANNNAKKGDLFKGFSKEYAPLEEGGQKLPPEKKQVQARVPELVNNVRQSVGKQLDVWFRRDTTNCEAKADVVVDGIPVIKKAPVSFLLALEKRLVDVHTFVNDLPTLDLADKWEEDKNDKGIFRTPETVTTQRTDKVVTPIVVFQPSEHCPGGKHEMVSLDKLVGHWETTKFSGAIQPQVKREWIERIAKLREAVKTAREEANSAEVIAHQATGESIFNYIFGKVS